MNDWWAQMAVRCHEEVIIRVGVRFFHRRRERIKDVQRSGMQKQSRFDGMIYARGQKEVRVSLGFEQFMIAKRTSPAESTVTRAS